MNRVKKKWMQEENVSSIYNARGEFRPYIPSQFSHAVAKQTLLIVGLSILTICLNFIFRHDFDWIAYFSSDNLVISWLCFAFWAIVIIFITGCIHELIHYAFCYMFIGKAGLKWTWKGFHPYVYLPQKLSLCKKQAMTAISMPLVVITAIWWAGWFYFPLTVLPIILLAGLFNVLGSISDVNQLIILAKEPNDIRVAFGEDGINQILF